MVTVYFWIVPTSLGQIPIEVRAVTGVAADSLIVNLFVKVQNSNENFFCAVLKQVTFYHFISTTCSSKVNLKPTVHHRCLEFHKNNLKS